MINFDDNKSKEKSLQEEENSTNYSDYLKSILYRLYACLRQLCLKRRKRNMERFKINNHARAG